MSTSRSFFVRSKIAGALLLSAALSSAADKLPDKVTYEEHIKPLMRSTCLNCHNPEKHKAGLDMTTYQGLIQGSENGKVVVPGDPDKSLLFRVVTHSEEPKMPPKADKLADAELELIRKFIEAGAPENAGSKVVVMKGAEPAAVLSDEKAPDGPPPMPKDLLLEPVVRATRAGQIAALTASRWAPLVAVAGQKQVLLYNTDTLDLAGVLPFPEGFPYVLKFSRNCRLLLAGGGVGASYGRVVVWDVVTGERVLEAGDETDAVLAADISPDHSRIVLGGPSKWLKVFSGKDGTPIKQIKKHTDWVTAIAFSPDGKKLVTADRSGNVLVWDANVRELFSLTGHKGAITSLACAGNMCASASEDGTIKLWDLKEGSQIKSWNAHNGGVSSVEFTSDGKLVSCGRDRSTKLWDQNGKALKTFEEFSDVALRATFTSGKVIAGDWTGLVRVWNSEDVKRLGELSANPPRIAERIDATTKHIAELQSVKEKNIADLASLENTVKQANADVEAAKNAATQAEARVNETGAQLAVANKTADEAKAGLQTAVNKHSETLAALQSIAIKDTGDAEATNRVLDIEISAVKTQLATLIKAQANVKAANDSLAGAMANLEAGKQAILAKTAQSQRAADALAKAKQSTGQTAAQIATAKNDLGKWKAAQINTALHAARAELAKIEPEYNRAAEADKAAIDSVEKARSEAAEAEKFLATAFDKIKEKEKSLAEARAKSDAAEAAEKSAREQFEKSKEAFAKTSDEQAAQETQSVRGAEDAAFTKIRAELDAYDAEARKAKEACSIAEQALAQFNAEVQSAPERLHKLRAAVHQTAAQAAITRTEAANTIRSLHPHIAAAKAKVEKLKNEYEAARDEASMVVVSRQK